LPKEKTRIDQLLVDRGLSEDLTEARALVMSGVVMVNNQKIVKSGTKVSPVSQISLTKSYKKYASRGALKLKGALDQLGISPDGRICVDVGASTGGFTDILLQYGAARVYAFDVGYGQMISRLRNDPRVKVQDRFNIKEITPADTGNSQNLFIVIDVSFISLKSVLPALRKLKTQPETVIEILALLKPQFEARESELENGIVRDREAHFRILKNILRYIKNDLAGKISGLTASPVRGKDGNTEFFIHMYL